MKHLGDITKINGAEIEIVDVITGGSPCRFGNGSLIVWRRICRMAQRWAAYSMELAVSRCAGRGRTVRGQPSGQAISSSFPSR